MANIHPKDGSKENAVLKLFGQILKYGESRRSYGFAQGSVKSKRNSKQIDEIDNQLQLTVMATRIKELTGIGLKYVEDGEASHWEIEE